MDNKYGTVFLETEALLATVNEDDEYLKEVLAKMLPGELGRLERDLNNLRWVISDERVRRRARGRSEGGQQ